MSNLYSVNFGVTPFSSFGNDWFDTIAVVDDQQWSPKIVSTRKSVRGPQAPFVNSIEAATPLIVDGNLGNEPTLKDVTAIEVFEDQTPVSNEPTDLIGETFPFAAPIALGQIVQASLNYVGDRDMVTITLAAGQGISLEFFDLADNGRLSYRVFDSWGAEYGGNSAVVGTGQTPFFAERGGTYFIRFDSIFSSDLGTYSFRVNEIVDDFPEDVSSQGLLTVGGTPIAIRNDFKRDFDVFQVQVNTPSLVRFEPSNVSAFRSQYYLALYDQNGGFLADFDAFTGDQGFVFNFLQAGTYFLGIEKYVLTEDGRSFTVSATTLTDDSYGLTNTTRTIAIGGPAVAGVLDYNQDIDAFRLSFPMGGSLSITADSPSFAHVVSIFSSTGILLAESVSFDQNLQIDLDYSIQPDLIPGDIFVVMSGRNASDKGSYTLQVAALVDDYAGASRGALTLGSTATGTTNFKFDGDAFRFSAVAGQTVRFSAVAVNQTAFTGYELSINLITAPNFPLEFGYLSFNPTLTYSFATSGQYDIRIIGYEIGSYIISASILVDDYASSVATTGVITVGGTVNGTISEGDPGDWFRFQSVAGERVQFAAAYSVAAGSASSIEIYRPNGSTINDSIEIGVTGGGTGASRSYTFLTSETYYIKVSSSFLPPIQTSYSFSATRMFEDWGDNINTTGVLTLGGPAVSGVMNHSGDNDWFGVNMVAGQYYVLKLNATSAYSSDPAIGAVLSLYDAAGQATSIPQPRGTNELVYQADVTGVYYAAVSSTGDTRNYTISAAQSFGNPLDAISTRRAISMTGPYPNLSDPPSKVVDLYFAKASETLIGINALSWTQSDIDAVIALIQSISAVVDITFRVTTVLPEADITLFRYAANNTATTVARGTQKGNPIPAIGISTAFSELVGAGLASGGLGAAYILNAMGYALGLSFPHAAERFSYRMPGVNSEADIGVFGTNQGVHTMMSFNDGWINAPFGAPSSQTSGYQAGPMALDIAALQALYGARTNVAMDNTTYQIADSQTSGVGWRAIWDNGGIDQIIYSGGRDTVIDLRPATLTYGQGGGGYLSYATGVHGGYSIASGVTIEFAISGSGNDTLIGNATGNYLAGLGGADLLDGGLGNDWLAGGLGNDVILGGSGFDTAEIAALGSSLLIRQGDGRGLMTISSDGLDRLQGVELLRLLDGSTISVGSAELIDRRFGDFNGDGRADIGFRNVDGTFATWTMNGSNIAGVSVLGQPGFEWRAIGEADFDGNGRDEILWRNNTGALAQWQTDGSQVTTAYVFDSVINDWMVTDLADYTGDGRADILWRSNTGAIAIWAMNGFSRLGDGIVATVGSEWQLLGSGDFNGDGRSEILWRNDTNGQLLTWNVVGATLLGTTSLGLVGAEWDVAALGDVSGDGRSDIIWRNNVNGSVAVWEMGANGSLSSGAIIGAADLGWNIQGAGDFNGDGRADLMWTRGDGTTAFWFLNGASVTSTALGQNTGGWLTA